MTRLRSGSATDIGRNPRRTINQDMILESDGIFAVADGMGGHLGGEVASLTAIEALREHFSPADGPEGLERAIVAANQAVVTESSTTADLNGHGHDARRRGRRRRPPTRSSWPSPTSATPASTSSATAS